eukprot:g28535.t1
MVQEDRLQGTGIRNTPAGTHGHDPRANRSGINILKTNARSHVNKADKMGMTISQRQLTDPLYAFNCAAQDLSPLCISFLEKLANAVIPDPPRTHQMIMQGVGHRYAGKLIYINDPEKVGEADMSKDFLVYWKNRLYRPEVFAASYAQNAKRPPILGFHSEWKTDEKDPDELLQLLLDFIAEDIAFIPNVDLQLGKETRTMVVPRAKADSASAKALARAAQDQAPIASCYPHDVAAVTRFFNSFYLRCRVRPGAIIVVHDRWHTAETLRKALPRILKSGMRLGTLSELEAAYEGEMGKSQLLLSLASILKAGSGRLQQVPPVSALACLYDPPFASSAWELIKVDLSPADSSQDDDESLAVRVNLQDGLLELVQATAVTARASRCGRSARSSSASLWASSTCHLRLFVLICGFLRPSGLSLTFPEIRLANVTTTRTKLGQELIAHCIAFLLLNSPVLLGSCDLFGNPVQAYRHLRSGLGDLVQRPLGGGLGSLARHTASASLLSLAALCDSLRRGAENAGALAVLPRRWYPKGPDQYQLQDSFDSAGNASGLVFGSRGGQVVLPFLWSKFGNEMPPSIVINGGCAFEMPRQPAWPKNAVTLLVMGGNDYFRKPEISVDQYMAEARERVPKHNRFTAQLVVPEMGHVADQPVLSSLLTEEVFLALKQWPSNPQPFYHTFQNILLKLYSSIPRRQSPQSPQPQLYRELSERPRIPSYSSPLNAQLNAQMARAREISPVRSYMPTKRRNSLQHPQSARSFVPINVFGASMRLPAHQTVVVT